MYVYLKYHLAERRSSALKSIIFVLTDLDLFSPVAHTVQFVSIH